MYFVHKIVIFTLRLTAGLSRFYPKNWGMIFSLNCGWCRLRIRASLSTDKCRYIQQKRTVNYPRCRYENERNMLLINNREFNHQVSA